MGPNGCGKSSIFDAFEEKLKDVKGAQHTEQAWFFDKFAFHLDAALRNQGYNKNQAITLMFEDAGQSITKKTFHIRSAYRFTPSLDVQSISAQPDILEDKRRPHSSIALDNRLQENYERLLGLAYGEFERGKKTGEQVREELLGRINEVLKEVLDVRVSSMGNVIARKGQLYFEKEDARDFPYQNLSSGEKEVIDLIKVLSKALLDVELLLLHDRDERTDAARTTWLNEAPHHRMLVRREIENCLLDFDVLAAFCASKGKPLSRTDYDAIVTDIVGQDLKAGQTISQLKALCDERQKTNTDFKKALAEHLRGTSVHRELRIAIFPEAPATAASAPTGASTQGVSSS